MNDTKKPTEVETVSCEVCLKEIPLSESTSEEAADYVVHFCGLDCHAKWREQEQEQEKKQE